MILNHRAALNTTLVRPRTTLRHAGPFELNPEQPHATLSAPPYPVGSGCAHHRGWSRLDRFCLRSVLAASAALATCAMLFIGVPIGLLTFVVVEARRQYLAWRWRSQC